MEDLRGKIEDNTKKRKMENQDLLLETQALLKKVSQEMESLQGEVVQLKAAAIAPQPRVPQPRGTVPSIFEWGFNREAFGKLHPMGALRWISNNLTERFKLEILSTQEFPIEAYKLIKGTRRIGARTCGNYNQGNSCSERWHDNDRQMMRDQHRQGRELRLHCCTLCFEVLEIIVDHPVTRCPWIMKRTWEKIRQTRNQ